MDKYEKKVRVNQIISCIQRGEYQDAQEIADSIDWRQEKSIRTLRMVSEVYKINKRYEESFTVLNLAYEKDPEDPIKRKIVYDLCELAIKMGQFGIAVHFMKEFSQLAPRDPGRYILQYRMLKATDADYGERIELLEEFKSRHFGDFDGKWAYELAYLYHLTGKGEKCVECCNEIALWFVTGPVVIKALKLKREHVPLSYEEEQKLSGSGHGTEDEEVLYQKRHETDTAPVYMDTTPVIGDGYSSDGPEGRGQIPEGEEVPDDRRDLRQSYPANADQQELNIEVKQVDPSMEPTIRMAEKQTGPSIMSRETNVLPDLNKPLNQAETEKTTIQPQDHEPPENEPVQQVSEDTAHIPVEPDKEETLSQTGAIAQQEISINLDKFSTMNLQAELKENMEKLQEETGEPLREKEEKLPDRVAEPDKELTELKAENDTKQISTAPEVKEAAPAAPARDQMSAVSDVPELSDEEVQAKITRVPVPDQFRNIISQEMDGQMQLNVPEEQHVDEKQITGQMDIESILAEWDKLQEEARERRIRAAKRKSLEQTNELQKPLADILTGYELPIIDDEEELQVKKESKDYMSEPQEFTAPLVVSGNSGPEADVPYTEEIPEAVTEGSYTERSDHGDLSEETGSYDNRTPENPPENVTADEEKTEAPDVKDETSAEQEKKKPHFVTYETVELPSVFDSFLNIKGLAPQLKEAEDRMSMASSHGNVLVIGSEHAARMELIQAIVRDMGEKEARGEIKAAAIDADTFNNKDVSKSIKALAGNVLVIESAGRLSDDAMNALLVSLTEDELNILVILEDSKGGARNLSEYNRFDEVFDVLIDIPTLSNDYLVDHAKNYAREKDYTLDDMAVLALYQRIDERQTADHVVTSDEVEHIIDAAIKKANKKNLKHLGDVLFGKRYNDDDLIVLREKDFAK